MRKILYKEKNDPINLPKNKQSRSNSSTWSKNTARNNYILTTKKAESKILVCNQLNPIQIPSLKLIKKQQIGKSSLYHNAETASINDEYSPYIYSQRTTSQYNMQSYMSSKKSIYKQQPQQNYETQVKLYDTALKQILYRQDQSELMDFDTRYYRCARQRKLRAIIRFLLKKSKDQQISLQDLIDNKITQARPYQTQGSFAFIFYVKKGVVDKVEQMLTSNPLHVHDFDEKLMTPLHIATLRQNLQMIKILISFGANIMAKDLTENSALFYAIQQNQIDIIRIFLSLQCPSDAQYLPYIKLTKNQKIKKLLKYKKLEDIKYRCSKYENLIEYISHLASFCI